MPHHVCSIVPPYLLSALAECDDPALRESARKTLAVSQHLHSDRQNHFAAKLAQSHHGDDHPSGSTPQRIVPDYLLEQISRAEGIDDSVKDSAAKTIALSQRIRDGRAAGKATDESAATAAIPQQFWRGVYDLEGGGSDETQKEWKASLKLLPGKPVRLEGQPAVRDKAVNEAYDNCQKVLDFYKKVFNYTSIDGHNMHVISSVHYSQHYANAMWTSEANQMIYGDGNTVLYNFTSSIDVIGHEMTHGVTQFNSNLQYWDEAGALNEHISDVFGIMVKQMVENTTAEESDWLIGEGCLFPGVRGVALRNMKEPGTAYNDPKLGGKDIQPANYADIPAVYEQNQEIIDRDAGGVHIYSGIPNRAFVLCALAFGGHSWEKAGQIWFQATTTHRLRIPPECTFIQFADVIVDTAAELYGDDGAKLVRAAWNEVGVKRRH